MKKVAFLLADGFEDSEMQKPYEAVKEAGYETEIIGLEKGAQLKGKKGTVSYTSDLGIDEAQPAEYDAVVIPGGQSPENLRTNDKMVEFVKQIDSQKKTVAAICHGPQLLASADLLKGRTITSYNALEDDMVNAGASFEDKEVVVDGNFVTSRNPNDEPAFIRELLTKLKA
ncbi:general stress protein 18 [Paenibacillus sp. J31TS4]|uniref:type 1 glutamine amidotransferase domain-containing protein n=1 Tax=Paenibacillus sp. J31TS4 TaxID=2807195 RepID=UPI001B044B6D|nr:type 1 glutamine amidotransferase domain-containing protein [Paenibacillus sp. J31TS4]GIP40377.1 general stress protein 18 [Paenibacillus sp. J31TS4]